MGKIQFSKIENRKKLIFPVNTEIMISMHGLEIEQLELEIEFELKLEFKSEFKIEFEISLEFEFEFKVALNSCMESVI